MKKILAEHYLIYRFLSPKGLPHLLPSQPTLSSILCVDRSRKRSSQSALRGNKVFFPENSMSFLWSSLSSSQGQLNPRDICIFSLVCDQLHGLLVIESFPETIWASVHRSSDRMLTLVARLQLTHLTPGFSLLPVFHAHTLLLKQFKELYSEKKKRISLHVIFPCWISPFSWMGCACFELPSPG